jgi:hypothetical protein
MADSTSLVIHATGEVIDTTSPDDVAQALRRVRDLRASLLDADRELTAWMVEHSKVLATKTMHLGAATVTVKPDSVTLYDADAIEQGLLDAGMPAGRVQEIVKEEVTVVKKVMAVEAKKAARMNPVYAQVIGQHSTVVAKTPTVTVTVK